MHRPRFGGVFVDCTSTTPSASPPALPTSSPRTLSARNPDDPERLGRGVLEMPPLALPAVAPLGREAAERQLPDAQPQYRRRDATRPVVHAGAPPRRPVGVWGAFGGQKPRLARRRSGGGEGGGR